MTVHPPLIRATDRAGYRPRGSGWPLFVALSLLLIPRVAHASIFHGETLDAIAEVVSWVALIVAPIALIVAFLMVHVLPEKIAEKRGHPQAKAIKTLCLLSLVFGGLLWPLAWLWAYSRPVFYKMAYGTDVVDHGHGGEKKESGPGAAPAPERGPERA